MVTRTCSAYSAASCCSASLGMYLGRKVTCMRFTGRMMAKTVSMLNSESGLCWPFG